MARMTHSECVLAAVNRQDFLPFRTPAEEVRENVRFIIKTFFTQSRRQKHAAIHPRAESTTACQGRCDLRRSSNYTPLCTERAEGRWQTRLSLRSARIRSTGGYTEKFHHERTKRCCRSPDRRKSSNHGCGTGKRNDLHPGH